jgi:tyrosyl-tRNA synthetase
MWRYYELLTSEDTAALKAQVAGGALHPMAAKQRLARALVARFHGEEKAEAAEAEFVKVHREREVPAEIWYVRLRWEYFLVGPDERPQTQYLRKGPEETIIKVPSSDLRATAMISPPSKGEPPKLLRSAAHVVAGAGLAISASHAFRLIRQGGIRVDGVRIGSEFQFEADREYLIQKGKREFRRVWVG